jgi:hypothetical protein
VSIGGAEVRIRWRGRFGIVPEALLEDSRLSLDTRAVAAWLAAKPPDWVVIVGVMRKRLGLSEQRWLRKIAPELECAGYLLRERRRDELGRIDWRIEFYPDPDHLADSSDKTIPSKPMDEESAHGEAKHGKGRDKYKQGNEKHVSKTKSTQPPPAVCCDEVKSVLAKPSAHLSARQQGVIAKALAGLSEPHQLALANELVMQRAVIRNVIGWIKSLAQEVRKNGEFSATAGVAATHASHMPAAQPQPANPSDPATARKGIAAARAALSRKGK